MVNKMKNEKEKDLIIENRFHKQLIGPKGENIQKIRDDFSVMEYGLMDYFINIINIMGCSISFFVVIVIIANIIEALLYYKIFSFIKRYVSTYIRLFNITVLPSNCVVDNQFTYTIAFSKIDPRKSKIAAKNLSETVNETNMRKLKVNAQVTAMTSIIEALGNILQWSIWIFITKFAGYGTLIQSILLYFVALPYVFLMNTSQNKERVIESGWFNVLKNAFGNGEKVIAIRSWCQNYWKCNLSSTQSRSQIVRIPSRSKNVVDCVVQNLTINGTVRLANNNNIICMTTVFRDQNINETKNRKALTLNVPMDISTISNNFHQQRVIVDNRIINNNIRTQSGRNSNTSHLTWTQKRGELLKDLLSNVSNDDHTSNVDIGRCF